jgi:hypothetical protein
MSTFLDLRTSQGIRTGAVSTNGATPDYVAGLGLQVDAGTNVRVELNGTIGVFITDIIIGQLTFIVKQYTDPAQIGNFGEGVEVFRQTAALTPPIANLRDIVSFSAADIVTLAPPTGILAYALFVFVQGAAPGVISYQGQQNLTAVATAGVP